MTLLERKLDFLTELDKIQEGLSEKFEYNNDRSDHDLFDGHYGYLAILRSAFDWRESREGYGFWFEVSRGLEGLDYILPEKTKSTLEQAGEPTSNARQPDYVVIPKVFPQFSGSYKACSEFIGDNYGAFRLLPKEQWDVVNKMLHSKIEVPDKAEDAVADVKKEFKRKLKILMDSID